MSVIKELKEDVSAGNIKGIRTDLWSLIAIDPNFTKFFTENLQYCIDNGISEYELFEKHDNRPMSDEVSNENFSTLCGQLRTNYSRERLEKIKEIGRKLYPVTEEKPESQTLTNKNAVHHKSSSASKKDDGKSGLLWGIDPIKLVPYALGAVAGGALGLAIFGKAVAVGIGAVAGGVFGGKVVPGCRRILSKK